MRILRQKIFGRGMEIGKIASPAAGDTDLCARNSDMVEDKNGAAALAGLRRAHHARRTRADNHDVPPIHQPLSRQVSLAFFGGGLPSRLVPYLAPANLALPNLGLAA